jgi:hypothetical protein
MRLCVAGKECAAREPQEAGWEAPCAAAEARSGAGPRLSWPERAPRKSRRAPGTWRRTPLCTHASSPTGTRCICHHEPHSPALPRKVAAHLGRLRYVTGLATRHAAARRPRRALAARSAHLHVALALALIRAGWLAARGLRRCRGMLLQLLLCRLQRRRGGAGRALGGVREGRQRQRRLRGFSMMRFMIS